MLPLDPPPSLLDSEETSPDVMRCPTEGSHDHMELRPEALLHPANRIGRSSGVAFPRRTSRGAVTQTQMNYYQGLGVVSCELGTGCYTLEDKQNLCFSSCILRRSQKAGPTDITLRATPRSKAITGPSSGVQGTE